MIWWILIVIYIVGYLVCVIGAKEPVGGLLWPIVIGASLLHGYLLWARNQLPF